ncbi:carbohydrate sulfotransferase 3-like isoform X2 [Littorina saxatilis]|uniref:carbohydrate sulfotransferase 3-like isoform X2 n=1 Tax=Littorina saxatilis TaxID=31220 RepID=UPI0038B5C502
MTTRQNGIAVIVWNSGTAFSKPPLAMWDVRDGLHNDNESTSWRERFPHLPTCSKTDAPEVKLLIVTYMRSGSTFTGDLFDQHPDVFYVYEPLHAVEKSIVMTRQTARFWDKPSVKVDTANKTAIEKLEDGIVGGYLNCNFQNIDITTLEDPFMKFGQKTEQFGRCRGQNKGVIGTFRCLPGLQRSCCRAKVVASKTIRYTMTRALTLMANDAKVKVIHLVRDPRATMLSREKYGKVDRRSVEKHCVQFCQAVRTDLQIGREAMTRFPDRILRVRYEDFASHPTRFAEMLLRFAGLEMTAKQREHLRQITSGPNHQCATCIRLLNTNSSYNAFSWRRGINLDDVKMIDKQCEGVYPLAGYLPLPLASSVRNLSLPSLMEPAQVPGFLS